MTYTARLGDLRFALRDVAGLGTDSPRCRATSMPPTTPSMPCSGSGQARRQRFGPLNRKGDKVGASSRTAWCARRPASPAYKEFVDGGWNSCPDPEFGGQGMPWLLAVPCRRCGRRPTWPSAWCCC